MIDFFTVGGFLLYIGIRSTVDNAKIMIKASGYTPQEVSIIDEEGILQQKDEFKAAMQKYSEKAGISFKPVVCYKIKGEEYSSYSVKRGALPDVHYEDHYSFLEAYAGNNDLITDNRTLILGMVYDGETSEFLEYVFYYDEDRERSYHLVSSQDGMMYMFEKKMEEGLSPEQAVIKAIDENLWRVEVFVPVNYNQYNYSDGVKTIGLALLFAAIGGDASLQDDAVETLASYGILAPESTADDVLTAAG
ncbi:MAG: hypothetical protein J6W36_07295, partial [Clostridiales bacterium]|nr:hypothetical protein [Clostridiales bacterium]